ncbi:hypothetical protein EFK50_01035 [Nocardioides marmoriginsengisoli]|uniref:Major tail protein n=1 Tax=Nocardioides marmoriginsengisoli TaxID=661483 RepID=A0A3N0CSJ6_9ACTN|nr:hypothetical protein [Nocardioides marmoriginsengisoli]RNL66241.1 hypothetical protein EFK50_01035 [Nocardioides marmoriginsengisoli]
MAAPIRPTSTKAYGREKWLWVPAIANLPTPAIAEINAATGLDVSCMLFASTTKPSKNTNLVDRERRICDTTTFQQIGTTTYGGGEMLAAFDEQGAALSNGVKAWEKFPEGTAGFLVRRLGILVATDFAVGQFVSAFPVEFGPPFPIVQGDGEAAEVGFSSTFAITAPPAFKVAITA